MSVNAENYKDYLLRRLDDDLSPSECAEVDAYMLCHAEAVLEWRRLQATRLRPDAGPVFPFKERLYRREEELAEAVVVPLAGATPVRNDRKSRWWAAAAVIAGLALTVSLWNSGSEIDADGLAVLELKTPPATAQSELVNAEISKQVPAEKSAVSEDQSNISQPYLLIQQKNGVKGVLKAGNPGLAKVSLQEREVHKTKIEKTSDHSPDNRLQVQDIYRIESVVTNLTQDDKGQWLSAADAAAQLPRLTTPEDQEALADQSQTAKSRLVKTWASLKSSVRIWKQEDEEGTFLAISVHTDNVRIKRAFRAP